MQGVPPRDRSLLPEITAARQGDEELARLTDQQVKDAVRAVRGCLDALTIGGCQVARAGGCRYRHYTQPSGALDTPELLKAIREGGQVLLNRRPGERRG